jgi:hypothetical protein
MSSLNDAAQLACPSCGKNFHGKYCSHCGEKIFHPSDLSLKKFVLHSVDMFTHLDAKFFGSLKYLLFYPGFLTKSYITGARVKFGKPMQIFLLVNVFFYFAAHIVHATDYTPNYGDHHYFLLSNYKVLEWLAPLDELIVQAIDGLGSWKQQQLNLDQNTFLADFLSTSWLLSKLFVVLLIPLYALVFWVFIGRRLNYVGAAFVFAAHFVAFQLVVYSLGAILFYGLHVPWFAPLEWLLFSTPLNYVSNFLFNNHFEVHQIVLWFIYLFFAFQKIAHRNPLVTLVIAFLVAKILFFVTFGIYKKILILVSLLMM